MFCYNFRLFEDSLFSSFYSQRDNIVYRFLLMLLRLQQAGLTFKSILLAKSPYIVHLIEIQNESILNKELKRNDVTDVYVCGLCTDICVGSRMNLFMIIKVFFSSLNCVRCPRPWLQSHLGRGCLQGDKSGKSRGNHSKNQRKQWPRHQQ